MSAIFLQGNAVKVLQGLPADFFQVCVTSPPYFGLRKYQGGIEQWEDGWSGQLGAEPTPDLYISHLVQIMREVRRVLRPDGVFWLNIGDSWSGSGKGQMGDGSHAAKHGEKQHTNKGALVGGLPTSYDGCKPLDMILIPSLLALAARADGWYVRSISIWDKKNPMPESVNGWRWERHKVKVVGTGAVGNNNEKMLSNVGHIEGLKGHRGGIAEERAGWADCPGCPKCSPNDGLVLRKGSWRPTDSYEQILMLTKTDNYFCDREATREDAVEPVRLRERHNGEDTVTPKERGYDSNCGNDGRRNLRSVWSFPTKPGKFNHYAAYPPRLPEICVKSSTSGKGCCPECGSPWVRVIEKPEVPHDADTDCKNLDGQGNTRRLALLRQAARERGKEYSNHSNTVGWRPTCDCGAGEPVPCRALDPFSGAGTTALVCEQLGLDSVSIDTSAEYIELSRKRLADDEQRRLDEFIKKASNGRRKSEK